MIHFNQLEITDDNKYLIIDAQIDDGDYFSNMYLDAIVIDSQDTFILNGPSNSPIYTKTLDDNTKAIYIKDFATLDSYAIEDEEGSKVLLEEDTSDKPRRVRLYLTSEDLGIDLSTSMLFVYVIAGGVPSADIPCTYDVNKIMGTVVNLLSLYRTFIPLLSTLGDTCNLSNDLPNAILLLSGIRLAIKTGHYTMAIKIWKKLMGMSNSTPTGVTKGCNCNANNR